MLDYSFLNSEIVAHLTLFQKNIAEKSEIPPQKCYDAGMFSEKHASAAPTETDSQENPVWEIPISDSDNPVGPLPLLDHGAAIPEGNKPAR